MKLGNAPEHMQVHGNDDGFWNRRDPLPCRCRCQPLIEEIQIFLAGILLRARQRAQPAPAD